jgi:mannose/fructose-specific phosphotransferase system component IIA
MIIIYDTNKNFHYKYIYRRDYKTFENTFLINVIVALDYLYENDILLVDYSKINKYKTNRKVNIIDVLVDRTDEPIYIRQFHKNQYQPSTNTIFFNDTQGATFRKNYRKKFTTKNQGFNSPLALFAHEIIHCYHELHDEEQYQERRHNHATKGKKIVASGADLSYPNKEEELVVLLTNQVVKKLDEDIRTNYGRSYYDVDNVLSIRKV